MKIDITKRDYELIRMLLRRELLEYSSSASKNGLCKKYIGMILNAINNFAKYGK